MLPQSLREIGDEVFHGCASLLEISLPAHLECVGEGTFENCTALTRAVLAQGCTGTGERAFCNCTALEEVVIPEGVKTLEAQAFMGCTGLRRVVLPRSLDEIGASAFNGCTALEKIVLPSGIQEIKAYAFYQCTALRNITVPAGTELGDSAFESSGLEEAALNAVYSIPDGCFKNCASLRQVEVRGKLDAIYGGAFYNCSQLQAIHFPRGIRQISEHAFYGCKSLQEITLPGSITDIHEGAFENCTGLKHVKTRASWFRADIFHGCQQVSIEIVKGSRAGRPVRNGLILGVGGTDLLWCNRDASGTVCVPKGVKNIRRYAFEDCTHITRVNLPESVCMIENAAFSGCTSLKTLVLPEKLETIGDEVFRGSALTELTIPAGVRWVGEKILQDCPIRTVTVLCSMSVFEGVLVDPEPPFFALVKGGWGNEVPLGSNISWVRGYFSQLQRGENIPYLIDSVFRAYIQHSCEELWADPVCLRGMVEHRLLPAEKVSEALDAAASRGNADEAAEILEYQRTLQREKKG